jgi:hypothetical protein
MRSIASLNIRSRSGVRKMLHNQKYCFVAIPFRPELNFFFLYIKKYLEEKYKLRVERGDANVLTKPLMDKIRDQILRADLIIGDVTGGNANVFYELGIANASGKPILFLTQNPPEQAPVDIRQFEFIQYDLGKHEEFLAKLDNAIRNAFGKKYESLYGRALEILEKFNQSEGLNCQHRDLESFQSLVMQGENNEGIPPMELEYLFIQFILPKITENLTDIGVLSKYHKWIQSYEV